MSDSAGAPRSLDELPDADDVALAVSKQRRAQARKEAKSSLPGVIKPKAKPAADSRGERKFRQAWAKTAGGLSEEEQRKAVLQAIEVFKLLPAASQYAQHRVKVLHQALELLSKDRGERTSEESDELQKLLEQLKI